SDRLYTTRTPHHARVIYDHPRGRVSRDDEELAAVRIRSGIGHRQRPTLDLVVVELVLERVARAARPGSGRVSALNHEVLDHAVEDDAVVEAVGSELPKVLDRLRRVLIEELQLDRAVVGLHRRGTHPRHRNATRRW